MSERTLILQIGSCRTTHLCPTCLPEVYGQDPCDLTARIYHSQKQAEDAGWVYYLGYWYCPECAPKLERD